MDTYRHNTILPMSILCIHCQAIPLDDDQLGSHMTVTADGSKHLDFESDCESLVIPIDWQFEFDWPSLEQFNARLQRFYCPICRWIKDALIEIHADRMFELHEIKGFVKVSLSYAWGWSRGAARRGLQGLVMNAQFLSEQRNLIKSLSVEFRITSSRVISTCTSSDTLGAQPVASWLSLDDPITYLDPEYIQWMDEKLSICETHTQACHPMARENFIPDRLIDVSNDALKIVPKSEIWQRPETSDPRYAALSYCWGKKEDALAQAKLTTANMAQRLQSFDFSELTIPIQESVMVTRALGLRYLWVDALCITGSDWAVQCAIMDKIYRNAHVTICALGSASCRQGFLQKRAKMTLPFQSRLHPSITGSFAVDQPVIRETGHCLDPWSMDYDVAESNWDDRGWTFQENVLSTRMLLFGKRSVHFSCSEFHVSKQCRHWAGSESFQFPSATHMEYDRVELYDRWSSRLVTSYTDRTKTLTVGTDVLPAFAGTGRLFQELVCDEYVAGLWKGDLHRALIWVRVEAADDRVWLHGLLSSKMYMGPSWSWARLAHMCDGISFPMYQVGEYAVFSHTRCRPDYGLHHIEATPSGPNEFGAVSNGVLEIAAKLLSITSNMSTTEEQVEWCDESIFRLHCGGTTTADIQLDFECLRTDIVTVPLGAEASRLRLILIGSTIEEAKAVEFYEDDTENNASIECHIDPEEQSEVRHSLQVKQPLRPIEKKDRTAHGLVVYPTSVSGKFYRVGIFFSTPQSGGGLDVFDVSHTERITIV